MGTMRGSGLVSLRMRYPPEAFDGTIYTEYYKLYMNQFGQWIADLSIPLTSSTATRSTIKKPNYTRHRFIVPSSIQIDQAIV